MTIRILMVTHNRPTYLRIALQALCDSLSQDAKVVVWDNASRDETRRVLAEFESHPRIEQIANAARNEKLTAPTNWFWKNFGDADFLGKVDDDCVVPVNWCDVLTAVHHDIPEAGALACWHFMREDFNEEEARNKIAHFGRHSLLRNCWVCGSGYLMKQGMIRDLGLLKAHETFTDYCLRGAVRGYIHGWYYPFLYQRHLDDPRLESTGIASNAEFHVNRPLSAQTFEIHTVEEWVSRLRYSAQMLQSCSINPYDYIGFVARFKRRLFRLARRQYFPRCR